MLGVDRMGSAAVNRSEESVAITAASETETEIEIENEKRIELAITSRACGEREIDMEASTVKRAKGTGSAETQSTEKDTDAEAAPAITKRIIQIESGVTVTEVHMSAVSVMRDTGRLTTALTGTTVRGLMVEAVRPNRGAPIRIGLNIARMRTGVGGTELRMRSLHGLEMRTPSDVDEWMRSVANRTRAEAQRAIKDPMNGLRKILMIDSPITKNWMLRKSMSRSELVI